MSVVIPWNVGENPRPALSLITLYPLFLSLCRVQFDKWVKYIVHTNLSAALLGNTPEVNCRPRIENCTAYIYICIFIYIYPLANENIVFIQAAKKSPIRVNSRSNGQVLIYFSSRSKSPPSSTFSHFYTLQQQKNQSKNHLLANFSSNNYTPCIFFCGVCTRKEYK